MAKFMAIYTGDPNARPAELDHDAMARGMAAWQAWGAKYKDRIVEFGGPLGKTKRVDKNGVADASNNIAAYVIVDAESQDAAARMFVDHPHFAIFPGDGVDIMPCMPVPGA